VGNAILPELRWSCARRPSGSRPAGQATRSWRLAIGASVTLADKERPRFGPLCNRRSNKPLRHGYLHRVIRDENMWLKMEMETLMFMELVLPLPMPRPCE
jgi:hypothetical protein